MSEADGRAADAYEHLLVPGLFRPSAQLAVALAGARIGERALDVACGTGIGARLMAPQLGSSGQVVALDIDGGMLATAAQAPREPGATVDWIEATALALPLRDSAFDLCFCLQGLQFVGDFDRALAEMRRVLQPGGRLVLSTWGTIEAMPGHGAVYEALARQGIDCTSPRRGFTMGNPTDLVALAERAGFVSAEVTQSTDPLMFPSARHFVEGLLLGAPYTRRVIAGLSRQAQADCLHDACDALSRFEGAGGFVLPACVNLLRAFR